MNEQLIVHVPWYAPITRYTQWGHQDVKYRQDWEKNERLVTEEAV